MMFARKKPKEDGTKNIRRLLYVAIPVAIVGLAAIGLLLAPKGAPQPPAPPHQVVLEKARMEAVTPAYEFIGQLEAVESVDLKARVGGFLKAKPFTNGQRVKTDQLLFQIEPDQYQAQLESAEGAVISAQAVLDRATLDFKRQSDLYAKGSSPKSDFDSAKAAFDQAKAALMSAEAQRDLSRLNLDYAAIKAPFDGQISDTPYSIGSLLGPESGVLATVVTLDPIWVSFGVSDKMLINERAKGGDEQIRPGRWRARLKLGPDNIYDKPGELIYMAPLVDRQTDTVKLKAQFDNPAGGLLPGQTVTVIIEPVDPPKLLMVSKGSVLTDADSRYVFVPEQKELEVPDPADPEGAKVKKTMLVAAKRPVTVAEELTRGYVISKGLKEGDEILSQGLMADGATLLPDSPIEVVTAEAAAATEKAVLSKGADAKAADSKGDGGQASGAESSDGGE